MALAFRRCPRAGIYAQNRYERGLRAYRRRMRWPLLIAVMPMWATAIILIETHPMDWWSFMAGLIGASGTALLTSVRDDVPRHVVNWRLGAEGERKTETVLSELERQGWTVEDDIEQPGRANIDHIVDGPPGIFLLETTARPRLKTGCSSPVRRTTRT